MKRLKRLYNKLIQLFKSWKLGRDIKAGRVLRGRQPQ